MISRRQFLKGSALAGVGLALPLKWASRAWPFSQSPVGLRKFIQPLPGLGPAGLPVASPAVGPDPNADYYTIQSAEFRQVLHPDFINPGSPAYAGPGFTGTRIWGYADITNGIQPNHKYLGGVIVAKQNRACRITHVNNLPMPASAIVPIDKDPFFMDAATHPDNRIAIHLHGGHVPWFSDGGPFTWFDPVGNYGEGYYPVPDMPAPAPGSLTFYYPNDQSMRLMWYHDHAHDITRTNAYAGLASAYLLLDDYTNQLTRAGILPDLNHTIPLVLQTKTFWDPALDPNYPVAGAVKGDLWYPWLYEGSPGDVKLPPLPNAWQMPTQPQVNGWVGLTDRWALGPQINPLPVPSDVPEFFADTAMVNGAVYPYCNVEQRHYRFLVLNGDQGRFFNLQLYYAQSADLTNPLSGEANLQRPGPRIIQIGTEGGLLPFPVALNNPPVRLGWDTNPLSPTFGNANMYNLLVGPAERADVIVDFSNVQPGSVLILYTDAPAPFPTGDQRNDYFTGDLDMRPIGGANTTQPGLGPNTRTLMQFRVMARIGRADPPAMSVLEKMALTGAAGNMGNAILPAIPKLQASQAIRVRDLTLNEDFDEWGRLIQRLGTRVPLYPNTFGRFYMDPATETPNNGDVEIWRLWNLTGDTHPIHIHLVNFQILSRQAFDPVAFVTAADPTTTLIGSPRPPDPNEQGFKETARMNPNEMITLIMKFDLPKLPAAMGDPTSPRTGGHEYVWHCHILEHEEHDMMRPLVVG